ncbi:MAG: thioether cross-link-forming SCIFF peptide maturase [Peptoniphilaceae bacterium]|nr:thioether cross-link-forming SCIFF peptide maturase [Peptoniphilaceae bacterium]
MIHQFHAQGLAFAVDTYSGAVHLLDPMAEYAVEALDRHLKNESLTPLEAVSSERLNSELHEAFPEADEADLQETLNDLRELIANEQLFTEDPYADLSLKLRERKTYVKALCLNVAHTCNLDCDYCFASQGKYHGERALMSLDVAKRAIDFVIRESGPHRNIDIDFFGGEPALNWDVVKETVRYAREKEQDSGKHFRFTFTTNGMLLDDEMISFLNENMHNVVLSLDGRKEVHDRLRHTVDGRGSYDRIVPRFKSFVSSRGDQEYYMRGTYTKNNVDFYQDVLHMANLGFYRLSMEPVIGDPDEPYMLGPDDVEALKAEYDKLAAEMIRRNRLAADAVASGEDVDALPPEDHPFVFYHFMMNLEGGPCVHKRISGCGIGTEYLAVTPEGDLYPCHQFVGETDFKIGNVMTGIEKPELTADFKECNCYSRPDCQDCWAKLYCSGGCAANALHAAGDLQATVPLSCELFRKRVECALAIQADRVLYEPYQKAQ